MSYMDKYRPEWAEENDIHWPSEWPNYPYPINNVTMPPPECLNRFLWDCVSFALREHVWRQQECPYLWIQPIVFYVVKVARMRYTPQEVQQMIQYYQQDEPNCWQMIYTLESAYIN